VIQPYEDLFEKDEQNLMESNGDYYYMTFLHMFIAVVGAFHQETTAQNKRT
jgi:hypothetical protein